MHVLACRRCPHEACIYFSNLGARLYWNLAFPQQYYLARFINHICWERLHEHMMVVVKEESVVV